MKIVKLIAENVKRLVAVEIAPDGNLVQITGKNGQGKTSVLDSIWWALAGAANIQSAPIRKGADRARIRLDLGEIIITRTFNRKEGGEYTSSISVETADGARFPSPQKMIDSLLGELAFDPLAFARMAAKDQFDALRKFAPDINFEAIDNAHRGDFERRTEVNRFAKEARAAAGLVVVPADTPDAKIDETALVDEMQKAGEHNAQIEQRKANRERAASDVRQLIDDIKHDQEAVADLLEQVEEMRGHIESKTTRAESMQKRIDEAEPLPAPIDVSQIRAKIEQARTTNANVERLLGKVKHERLAIQYEQEAKDLTEKMDVRQNAKRAAIAEAKLPVPGITFGDGCVLLNGVPFEQGSDAEQLRASVAIAASMNPKLRVIRVRDGSLLDDDGIKLLAQIADESDMQVWVEKVDSTGKIGFVLEDGHLKADADAGAEADAA